MRAGGSCGAIHSLKVGMIRFRRGIDHSLSISHGEISGRAELMEELRESVTVPYLHSYDAKSIKIAFGDGILHS